MRNVRKMQRRTKKKKNKTDEELRKHNEMADGRKKRRNLKHAERRSRIKEDRGDRDEKKRRNSKGISFHMDDHLTARFTG